MQTLSDLQPQLTDAVESIFRYIERTAEHNSEGVCWQTLDYENRPHYDASIFNGASGIACFLAAYSRINKSSEARQLASNALHWCIAPNRKVRDNGLGLGRAGIGMAWLYLAQATGDTRALQHASAVANDLLDKDPGPATDFFNGVAGQGIFLLRLAETANQNRYLEGAVRYGSWLRDTITRNNLGAHWPARIPAPSDAHPPRIYGGFFHGSPGNAHFLLLLHEATGDPAWGELAREVAHTFISHGAQTEYGLNWPRLLETDELHRVQWCHGAPGVGLFYARAAEQLKDPAFLQTAEAAGETTYRAGDIRNNPGLCHGLAGNAELFLELYKITKNSLWLNRAYDFAQRALAYRTTTKNGDLWPADEPGLYSPDFLCGAAGTGYFFLQLLAPDQVRLPLL